MPKFTIAGLQLALPAGDNRERIEHEAAIAMARFPWIQMLVLPELATFGPALNRAEALPGPTERAYQALARRHGIWLVPGSIYERAGEQIFNTAPVIDPQGEVVARYRKIYPFMPYEQGVTPGREAVVFDVPGVGRMGVSICYDGWFPETTRAMVWQGAELIVHPTMTSTIDRPQELVIAQANAIMNQCYFIDINNAGALGNGRSIVVGPEGEVLYQAGELSEVIPLTVDFDRVRQTRASGTRGLGQMLKTFRDNAATFPCYAAGARSPALQALGALTMPQRPA